MNATTMTVKVIAHFRTGGIDEASCGAGGVIALGLRPSDRICGRPREREAGTQNDAAPRRRVAPARAAGAEADPARPMGPFGGGGFFG
jgi:hypothetical protein